MSKAIYNKILLKLAKLDEYLNYLKKLQGVQESIFISDFHYFGLAERYLQLVIEIVLDVAKLLVISENLEKGENNREIFVVLHENKIIDSGLVEKFRGIVGFRNILVHEYEKIDKKIVHKRLEKNLEDFVEFKKAVIKYLKKVG